MGFTVKNKGLLSLIQGGARIGYQQYGVSASGSMDEFSLRVANILVGNKEYEACIETLVMGPTITFDEKTVIAITGGNLGPMLNGVKLDMWRSYVVNKGETLSFSGASEGCRAYIAFEGGIDVPLVMESKSTYTKAKIGGFKGRALKENDYIKLGKGEGKYISTLKKDYIKNYENNVEFRVIRGPQDNMFDEEEILKLFSNEYILSNECDRMGYRLEGEAIKHLNGADIVSDGIAFGAIQVPGHGKPIIMMADRQTVGGYTKIGNVISVDLCKLSQLNPGDKVRFKEVDIYESHRLLKKFEDNIKEIKNNIEKFEVIEKKRYSICLNGVNFDVIAEEVK
ncbi:biotin-dependent carboxyltransferase family protein [Clostridium sp. CCUG 7971]|uniref:5-oxoprolinase subunit C family protein n=1 Tax=Clostridium sp. CCUG 7971 TaxID=2811414 RepID=UPI001ABA5D12|nr:biotin-dependent carboxyltransferase family protein [Clostridium sp. CCUG 7971]MBO3444903.1 biotin-dependent carboxyltransferase [Clostridium sp. CCUG 7971]